jgi:nucleoside-diphosphate-sugar epimerase
MKSVLVTGASGFVGKRLCEYLEDKGFNVTRAVRYADGASKNTCSVGSVGPDSNWNKAVTGIDVVVHLAARVHIVKDDTPDPLADYRRVNVGGTKKLALTAVRAGVKRFIYVSTIKVNGEATFGHAFLSSDTPHPVDDYARSKLEAEDTLRRIAADTGLEIVIVRPPLVYGPGVRANFLRLFDWIDRGIPFPFRHVANSRSLVALDNLVDLLTLCVTHPAAAGKVLLVSDDEDVSTTELIRRISGHMGKRVRLIAIPVTILRATARVFGKQAIIERLTGSLQVDICYTRELLNWRPLVTLDEALRETVTWYQAKQG